MDRQRVLEFQDQVKLLREDGKTIRAIADKLGAPRSNVHRAVRALAQRAADMDPISYLDDKEPFFDSSDSSTVIGVERPHSQESPLAGAFVGREPEMEQLKKAMEESIAGQPHLTMLVGEPGIGKTRISQEIASYARSRGAQVLRGRCYESMSTPPYWPWVQAIGSYIRECDPESLSSEMGVGASDIAEIVPGLRSKLPDLRPSARLEPEQARMRLFDSIVTFLKAATRSQPIILVLDNLHWADISSLLLLEFAIQELGEARIFTVCTYRDNEVSLDHPLSRTLGELTKEPHFQRLPLRGLTEGDVGTLIETVSGVVPSRTLIEQVHRRTGGNPLFVTEVVRLLSSDMEADAGSNSDPSESQDGWNVKIPEGVREAIGTRLYRLSPETNRVLGIASVVGREFGLELLRRLMPDMKIDHLLEALDEALAALVIEELHDALGGYQFGHSLIQETLYSELSSIRRAQLHASIAGALEEQYGLDSPTHASELAYHFARAEAVIGTRKSVSYFLLAGEHALESYAWEEALRNFQLGLKAKGVEVSGLVSAPDQVSADLLFGLGRAQVARAQSSQSKDAMNSFKPAFNQYVSSGDVERAVAIAVYPMPLIAGYVTGTGRLIEQALDLVPEDSLQTGRLQASYGRVKGLEDADYEAASQAFGAALDIARKNGDAELELQTLSYACDVDGYHIKMSEALDKGLRAVELSRSIDNPRAELMARLWCFLSLAMTGNLKNATEHAMSMLPLWERLRHPEYASRGLLTAAMASYYAGDLDTAREFSDQGLAVAPRDPRLLSAKVIVEYELGNFDEGRIYLDRFVEVATQSVPGPNAERGLLVTTIPAVISISGIDDYTPLVEQTCRLILDSESSTPGIIGFARIGAGLLSVLAEDATMAAYHYTELAESPAKEFALITGFPPGRLLGLMASAAGRLEQAVSDFEDSLNFCRLGGYRPALAWTCHDYAKALLHSSASSRSAQEETRIKVMSLLNEASSISGELRMRPLSERVAALEELATEQLGPAPTFPDRLTGREVEVLRFIAAGLSNREIAAELVLSARTVERHITNIYGKIKARGRADATSYAMRHELLDGN